MNSYDLRFFKRSGYTGHILEEEVLGHCSATWVGYMTYRSAMELAKATQPKQLCPIANRFRKDVVRELSIAKGASVSDDQVRIFTAVGSPLDHYHSVDGWFEFEGLVVTFDVTLNPNKRHYRADVTVVMEHPEEDFTIPSRDIVDAFKWAKKGALQHAPRS